MEKGKVEDALLGQILKTIEIINIKCIALEKSNLEKNIHTLRIK